jgi:site-specific recombinase XerD
VIGSKLAYINKYIKEVCKYAGILKKVSSHVARHTYTDIALQVSGGNIYQVQQSLGHRSVRTTEIYSRNRVNQQKNSIMMDIVGMMEEFNNNNPSL